MPELVAIAYEEEAAADRAVEEVGRCAEELLIDPDGAAVIVCERNGDCLLTISRRADTAFHWGEFWGALHDALLSGAVPVGLGARFRSRLSTLLRPGTSALLLVAPDGGKERALAALSHFDGQAFSCHLAADLPGHWEASGRAISPCWDEDGERGR